MIAPCQATGCMRVGEMSDNFGEATEPPPATVAVINPAGSVVAVVCAKEGEARTQRAAAEMLSSLEGFIGVVFTLIVVGCARKIR